MQEQYEDSFSDKFGGFIDFSAVGDQSYVQYAPIQDFNGKIIHLPFKDPEDSICTLIQTFRKLTPCKQFLQGAKQISFKHKLTNVVIDSKKYSIGRWFKHFSDNQIKVVLGSQLVGNQCALTDLSISQYYNQNKYKENQDGVKIKIKVHIAFDQHKNAGEDKRIELTVLDTDPIGHVKHLIDKQLKINSKRQIIIAEGKVLSNQLSIRSANIKEGDTILVFQERFVTKQDFKISVKKYQGELIQVNSMEDNEGQLIQNVFVFAANRFNIKKDQDYKISFNGRSLDRQKRLSDYEIVSGSILYLIPSNASFLENSEDKQNALIILKISRKQYLDLIYGVVKNWTVLEVLNMINQYRNKKQCDKFWCIQYGDRILLPHQKINILDDQFKAGMTIEVLKNEKFFFYSKLRQAQPFNPDQFKEMQQKQKELLETTSKTIQVRVRQNIKKRIFRQTDESVFVKQEFYTSIQCYTCNSYYSKINAFLRDNNVNQQGYAAHKFFRFANSLILSISKLPNHYGQVFRGIRNFKFIEASKAEPRQLICFKSFTSTSTNKDKSEKIFCNKQGTMFYISSITGKPINAFSVFQSQSQVLFPPFTYFLIDKIELGKNTYDKVYLTEVPSPSSFKKNTILWVDDIPTNNLSYIKKMQSLNAQILQVTSTLAANLWMDQFNKILQFKGVKLRVISDMVRYQKEYAEGQQDKIVPNYQAGISLLLDFNSKHKYTTKILIFCSDQRMAKQNTLKIENKNIRDKIWKVTGLPAIVQEYCKFIDN